MNESPLMRSLIVLKDDARATGKADLARMYQMSIIRHAAEELTRRINAIRRLDKPSS